MDLPDRVVEAAQGLVGCGEVPSGRAAGQRIAAIFGVESVVATGLVIVVLLKLLHT